MSCSIVRTYMYNVVYHYYYKRTMSCTVISRDISLSVRTQWHYRYLHYDIVYVIYNKLIIITTNERFSTYLDGGQPCARDRPRVNRVASSSNAFWKPTREFKPGPGDGCRPSGPSVSRLQELANDSSIASNYSRTSNAWITHYRMCPEHFTGVLVTVFFIES